MSIDFRHLAVWFAHRGRSGRYFVRSKFCRRLPIAIGAQHVTGIVGNKRIILSLRLRQFMHQHQKRRRGFCFHCQPTKCGRQRPTCYWVGVRAIDSAAGRLAGISYRQRYSWRYYTLPWPANAVVQTAIAGRVQFSVRPEHSGWRGVWLIKLLDMEVFLFISLHHRAKVLSAAPRRDFCA